MTTHKDTSTLLQSAARNLCVIVIIISPWLVGSSDGWAYLLMCMLTGCAAIIWLFSLLSQRPISLIAPKVLLAMLLFAAFIALQALPLPQRLIRILNPASAVIAAQESVVMESASDTLTPLPTIPDNYQPSAYPAPHPGRIADEYNNGKSQSGALSVAPHGTNRALLLIIAFISIFAILSNTVTTWQELRRTVGTIVSFGTIMVFIGLIHKFSGSEKLLWFHQPRYGGRAFGPFTNGNHFTVHINMIFALALGLFMSRPRSNHPVTNESADKRFGSLAMLLLAMTILGGATCFSLSRGGIVSLLAAIGIASLFWGKGKYKSSGMRLKASVLLVIAGTIWFGWEPIVNELGTLANSARDPLQSARFVVARDTMRMFHDYPIFGCGLGTFQYLFPSYQSLSGYDRWLHAHNDWAQLTAEGGILGAGLFLLAVCSWGRYLHSRQKSTAPGAGAFALGTLVGILATAIYSFWEYGMHKPANGFLLMGLAGLSVAAISMREQPATRSRKHHVKTDATPIPSGSVTRVIIAGFILLTAWQTGLILQQLKGELAYTRFLYCQKRAEKEMLPEKYGQAVLDACREAEIMYITSVENPAALREISVALTLWSIDPQLNGTIRIQTAEAAVNAAHQAVVGSPSDFLAWVTLARTYAVLNSWETAEIYLEYARELAAPGMPVRMFLPKE